MIYNCVPDNTAAVLALLGHNAGVFEMRWPNALDYSP